MEFIITLVICLLIYFGIILLMNKCKNTKLTNLIFISIVFLCHIVLMLIIYFKYGASNWNFKDALPVANISPFMFVTIIVYFIMPSKIKKYYCTLVSLLSVGMFIAPTYLLIIRIVTNYNFYYWYLLNYIPHYALSLWGIYLVKSNQVELKRKDCLVGGAIIVAVAFLMMLANIIFNTSFFGLSFNENYNIYYAVLVSNAYLSALIYFCGLVAVLFIGYIIQKFLFSKKMKIFSN